MKSILIGKTKCHAAERLVEEFGNMGHQLDLLPTKELVVHVGNGKVEVTDAAGQSLLDRHSFLFRGMGKRAYELAVVARFLQMSGKCVVERSFAERGVHIGKFTPTMIMRDVPVLEYQLLFSHNERISSTLTFPLIVKSLDGSMGKRVRLAHDHDELRAHIELLGYPILLQQYVPIEADYRVVVVGGKPLGAMKRYRNGDDFLTTRAGGRRERVDLPEEALALAVRAADAAQLDIAGVDLVEYEGVWYKLEVNMSPQFKVFERATDINVAREIAALVTERCSA